LSGIALAKAYVNAPLFSSYEVNLDQPRNETDVNPEADFSLDSLQNQSEGTPERKVEFEINLHTFLESIDIFGGAPTIKATSTSSASSSSATAAPGHGGTGAGGQHRSATTYRRTDRPPEPTANGGKPEGWKRRFGTGFGDPEGGSSAPGQHGHDWSHSRPTSMVMKYQGHGSPLVVILDEPDVTTQCSLATFERSINFEYSFQREACMAQVIMKSEWLQEAIETIDSSCSKLTLHFLPIDRGGPTIAGPRPRRTKTTESLKLTADADFGAVEMDFPNEGNNMDLFLCEQATINSYRFIHLRQAVKALQVSMKVSLRTDERGLLCMQFLLPKGTGSGADPTMKVMGTPAGASSSLRDGHGYIQLMCCPLDEEMNELDEDDGGDGMNDAYSMHF